MKEPLITRRDFTRNALAATAGLSLLGTGVIQAQPAARRSSRVVIVRDEKALDAAHRVDRALVQRMLDQTILQLTGCKIAAEGWKSLFPAGEKVGLVPSLHLNPTHPELVELVREALQHHAGLPADKIVDTRGRDLDATRSCKYLICIPALKAHWLTGIGTVLKNYIMFSGDPQAYHDEENAKLGEIWKMPIAAGKTRLVLVDALYPLCDKGPQPDPRYKWHYNGLIAGTDPVAVETVCLQIITKKRELIKGVPWPLSPPPLCVAAADSRYGLGTSLMEEITIEHLGWDKERLV